MDELLAGLESVKITHPEHLTDLRMAVRYMASRICREEKIAPAGLVLYRQGHSSAINNVTPRKELWELCGGSTYSVVSIFSHMEGSTSADASTAAVKGRH